MCTRAARSRRMGRRHRLRRVESVDPSPRTQASTACSELSNRRLLIQRDFRPPCLPDWRPRSIHRDQHKVNLVPTSINGWALDPFDSTNAPRTAAPAAGARSGGVRAVSERQRGLGRCPSTTSLTDAGLPLSQGAVVCTHPIEAFWVAVCEGLWSSGEAGSVQRGNARRRGIRTRTPGMRGFMHAADSLFCRAAPTPTNHRSRQVRHAREGVRVPVVGG